MSRLTRFAIEHARFTLMLIATVVVAGIAAYSTQPRQEDPEITLRVAQVVARFPGLSPERVERLITRPIEEAIKQIPEIDEIHSVSSAGLSIVTPEIDPRYSDIDPIWSDLRNKMDDLAASLPNGTQGPVVNDDYGRVAVVTLALSGRDYSMAELTQVAQDIQDRLNALPLVARTDLYGVQDERIWLEFDPSLLLQFGLSRAEIVRSLEGQNVVLPGGTVNAGGQNVVIEPSGNFESIEEIRDLPISTTDRNLLYLQDIATIRRAYVDPPNAPVFYNGQPAIVLGVSMVESSNVVALGSQVDESIAQIRRMLPLGMNLDVAIFQPELVEKSISEATTNLLQTIGVVLAVVILFLGLRTGLIVGAMVPLTMMFTLVVMAVGDIALHRVSIAAIIVALGLLVDNGIVIAEDIRRRFDRDEDRLDATLAAVQTLSIPLLTSSLTTVLAFLPLALIADSTGEFLRSLGQVLAIALLSSWFLSISVTPALCFWFLKAETKGNGRDAQLQDRRIYAAYRGVLESILARRWVFIAAMLALLVLSGQVFQSVRHRSLGPSARNQFTIFLDLPAEAHIQETIDSAHLLSSFLLNSELNPEVQDVLGYVGGGGPRFFLALSPNDPRPNKAFLVVNTQEPEQIYPLMDRVEEFILRDLPGTSGRAELLFLGTAALGTVEIRVRGPRIETLRNLESKITQAFHDVSGVRAVRSDWENSVIKIRVDIDQERARRAGVTSQEIAGTLSAVFDGQPVTDYREGDDVIPVMLRAQADQRDSLDRVRAVEIYSEALGGPVPILQIADFSGAVEPSQIRRFDQERALTVSAKHPRLTALELYDEMSDGLSGIEIPAGYTLEVDGELRGAEESNQKLLAYAPHALFGILLLLVLQFDSLRRASIILSTIPLVFIGASFGLAIFGAYFDFTAMLGLFSLAGIIINNGIVLIDRIDHAREEGMDVHSAIVDAALARARPIVMTTITTVFGLIPLALFGSEFWYGMAIVIMAGLSVGSLLTLGFVPALYSVLFDRRESATKAGSQT